MLAVSIGKQSSETRHVELKGYPVHMYSYATKVKRIGKGAPSRLCLPSPSHRLAGHALPDQRPRASRQCRPLAGPAEGTDRRGKRLRLDGVGVAKQRHHRSRAAAHRRRHRQVRPGGQGPSRWPTGTLPTPRRRGRQLTPTACRTQRPWCKLCDPREKRFPVLLWPKHPSLTKTPPKRGSMYSRLNCMWRNTQDLRRPH